MKKKKTTWKDLKEGKAQMKVPPKAEIAWEKLTKEEKNKVEEILASSKGKARKVVAISKIFKRLKGKV